MPVPTRKLKTEQNLGDILSGAPEETISLSARALHKSYPSPAGRLRVLKGVDLECRRGETVAVVGASGVGKSTLLHVLGALDPPDSGSVRVAGEDPFALDEPARARHRNRKIGFVFQFHHLMPEFTAAENVALPLWIAGRERREGLEEAESLLADLGLSERAAARPDELSGGERQRVAVARALVTGPVVILGDEPSGNLDGETAVMVYERMIELTRKQGTALIVATHDMELAARTDRVLRLRDGRLHPA